MQRKEIRTMGLIRAGLTSLRTTLADQWKEYFYCDSLDADILVAKGQKRSQHWAQRKLPQRLSFSLF